MLLAPSDAQVALMTVAMVLGCVLTVAGWVYHDARAHAARGNPVVYAAGGWQIRTPVGWFVACVLLFELFIPAYLDNRRAA